MSRLRELNAKESRTFFLFAVCSAAIAVIYTLVPVSDALILVLGFPLGFLVSGVALPERQAAKNSAEFFRH